MIVFNHLWYLKSIGTFKKDVTRKPAWNKGTKNTLILMSRDKCTEVMNPYTVHSTLTYHRMLIILEYKKEEKDGTNLF